MKATESNNQKTGGTSRSGAVIAAIAVFVVLSCVAVFFALRPDAAPVDEPPVTTAEITPEIPADITDDSSAGDGGAEETAEPEPTPEPPPEEDPDAEFRARAVEILDGMTQTERLYQMFIVTPEVLTDMKRVYQAGTTTANAIAAHPVGGIIYSSWNIETDAIAKKMIENTKSYAEMPMFLVADESIENAEELGFNANRASIDFLPIIFKPTNLAQNIAALEASISGGMVAQEEIDESVITILIAKLKMGIVQ